MVTFLIYQSQVSIDIVTLFLNNARILEYFNSVYPFSHLCHYFHVFWFISTLYSKILFCTGGQLSYSFICLYTYGFIALIFFPQSRYHLSSFTFCLKYTHSITFMVDLLVVNSLCSFSVCLKYFNICICVCVCLVCICVYIEVNEAEGRWDLGGAGIVHPTQYPWSPRA